MDTNIDELNNEIIIDGLYWFARWRINNGKKILLLYLSQRLIL